MDKSKPTYRLEDIRRLICEGACRLTITARKTATSIGFSETEVQDTVLSLETNNFYKSVTEYRNHRVWQDVYKKTVGDLKLYIKLKIVNIRGQLLVIMSFKEDESY